MHIGLHVKYPLLLSDFNKNLHFPNRFSKNPHISDSMKICPVGAKLFHVDRRTDVTNIAVAFRDFENVPKISTDPT